MSVTIICNLCNKNEPTPALAGSLIVPTLDVSIHICRQCLEPIGDRIAAVVQSPNSTEEQHSAAAVQMFSEILEKFGEAILNAASDAAPDVPPRPAHAATTTAAPSPAATAATAATPPPPAPHLSFSSFKTTTK